MAAGLVRGQKSQRLAVGAVAGAGKIPVLVAQQFAYTGLAAAAELDFGQGHARRGVLAALRIDHADDAPAIGRDAQVRGAVIAPAQLETSAFEHVGHTAAAHIEHQQVRDALMRQVVVPVAVDGVFGGVGGVLAFAIGFHLFALGGHAAQVRPDPGDQRDATAVREPLEGFHAGGHLGGQPGLAAIGRDQVELRLGVLDALALAPRREGDPFARGRKLRLAVLLALGQRAGVAAQGRQEPQAGAVDVVGHRGLGDGTDGLGAIGTEGRRTQALQLPEQIDGEGGRGLGRHGAGGDTTVPHGNESAQSVTLPSRRDLSPR